MGICGQERMDRSREKSPHPPHPGASHGRQMGHLGSPPLPSRSDHQGSSILCDSYTSRTEGWIPCQVLHPCGQASAASES